MKTKGLFGVTKKNHCHRRTKDRRIANAQIQFYLTALTKNLKWITKSTPTSYKLSYFAHYFKPKYSHGSTFFLVTTTKLQHGLYLTTQVFKLFLLRNNY